VRNIGIRVYLTPDQVDALKLIADYLGDTVSALVRDALRLYLAGVCESEPHLLALLTPRRDGPHEPQ